MREPCWPPLTASSSAAPRVTGAGADSARASTETVAPAAIAPTAMAETKIFFMTLPLLLCGAGALRLQRQRRCEYLLYLQLASRANLTSTQVPLRWPLNRDAGTLPEDFREANHEPAAGSSFFFAARFRLRVAAAFLAASLRSSGLLLAWPFKTACRKRSLPMV
jgi:hypothetical protein